MTNHPEILAALINAEIRPPAARPAIKKRYLRNASTNISQHEPEDFGLMENLVALATRLTSSE
ncbi:hypothetical protein NIES2134_107630 [Thermostichus vulcanus NIES-2134]|nr:hypothetical protein NIES2134_107630 [Thermostichus vulcanus NIES-2134]